MWCPLVLLCVLVTATSTSASGQERLIEPAAGNKPHIVLILVDDWGWANVGYHRDPPTKEVQTPNFDSLCKQGIELDQHYAFKFCSPSRSSLMSGRLPIHVNILNDAPNFYNPEDPVSGFAAIPRNMTGIATKLKAAGYATHQVGKWDAGMATPDHTPVGRGFDTSFGYFHHANDYYTEHAGGCSVKTAGGQQHFNNVTDLWMTTGPADGFNGTIYEEEMFKKHVLEVLSAHPVDTPLFLYYAPHIVHTPLQVPQEYLDRYSFIDTKDRQIYHAMVAFLDDVIGNLTAALQARNLWNDTLIVVSADNGGPIYPGGGANNFPQKGGKMSNWQGGVRVNAFVSGGFVPTEMRGKKLDGYVALADWYATFCSLAGVDKHDARAEAASLPPVDGLDMWPMLSGQNMTSPRMEVPLSPGLISGDYKILVGVNEQAGWTGPQYPNQTNPTGGIKTSQKCKVTGCLYNIKTDPEEHTDLSNTSPDVLKHMQERLAAWEATAFNPNRGKIWPGACEVALDKYGGYWGPFVP